MGYWISKLESLPNIFNWYFFLVGDYRNHNLINDVFRDDFCIIAERIGSNAAIISQNYLLENDLQKSLKNVERGKLGDFLKNLETRNPGLLILDRHPHDLSDTIISKKQRNAPIIIYIPFEVLEMEYLSTNTLIADIVSFSKNENSNLIEKTSKHGCIKDTIEKWDLEKKNIGAITINYTDIYNRERGIRNADDERILHLDKREQKVICACCGHIMLERNEGNLVCPHCGVLLDIKGMSKIKVEGSNHKEVFDVANKLLDRAYSLLKKEKEKCMEKILIISALGKELQPILEVIDSPLKPRRLEEVGGRRYYIYEISAALTVICTSFWGMGQLNASIAVRDAVNYFEVDKVILTGICGGIDRKMNYGDIIISDQIVDYELAKIEQDDVQVRWNVYRSDFELVQSMKTFKSDSWFSYLKKTFPNLKTEKPNVYSGIVLSGNKVIANSEKIKEFKKTWVKALAVEMEASGIAATIHQMKKGPSFVMVKSICDFTDSEKNDNWQEYASYVSAVFVLNYIFTECNSLFQENILSEKRSEALPEAYQKVFSAIRGTYNLSEINVLAFEIGIDIEEIGGVGKSEKIVELIKYCQRRNLINKLIAQINIERNNLLVDCDENK